MYETTYQLSAKSSIYSRTITREFGWKTAYKICVKKKTITFCAPFSAHNKRCTVAIFGEYTREKKEKKEKRKKKKEKEKKEKK